MPSHVLGPCRDIRGIRFLVLAACAAFLSPVVVLATDLVPGRDIVISEISYNPPSQVGDEAILEYIELYNRGADPVDVAGWVLGAQSGEQPFSLPPGTVLPAGGYLVVARSTQSILEIYGGGLAVVGDFQFRLGNGGDIVRLFGGDGHLVDQVDYDDDAPWNTLADGDGATLERISLADDMTDFTNFSASVLTLPTGTPGMVNSRAGEIPARFNVVINEIMYHPVVDPDESRLRHCENEEFVEVHNRGDVPVDISGWKFTDGVAFTFADGTVLEAGGHLAVFRDRDAFVAKYGSVTAATGPYEMELDNGGEDLLLADQFLRPVDHVDYQDRIPWPINPDGNRGSMELVDPWRDNDRGQAWRQSAGFKGTPGLENSATARLQEAGGNSGPQITRLRALRADERTDDTFLSTDAVLVEARILDPAGVSSAVVEFQAMAPGAYIRRTDPSFATEWTSMPMAFNGETGKYEATIPPMPHRTLVRYRIVAIDGDSPTAEARAPFPRDPEPNLGYFVYDGVPDYVASQSSDFGPIPHVHTKLEKVPVYFIVGHTDDIDAVQNVSIPTSMYSLYRHRITFVHEGHVYDHCGVRLRGSTTSRFSNPKRSWKVKFNKGNRFQGRFDDGTRYPNDRSKINIVRATKNGFIEALALKVYGDAGVIASATTFVHFRIVQSPDEHDQFRGDFFGLYLDLQSIDKVMMQDLGKPVDELSSIYKFRGFPDKKHPDCDPDDRSDLEAFQSGLAATDDRSAYLLEHLDVPRYQAFHAVTYMVDNTDMDSLKNYYYFHNSRSARWEVVPWDLDGAFRQTSGNPPLGEVAGLFALEYKNRYRFIWQVAFDQDHIEGTIKGWQSLVQEVADANRDRWSGWPLVADTAAELTDTTRRLRIRVIARFIDSHIPHDPVNARPFSGSGPVLPVILGTAAFSDPDAGDTHAATRWMIIEKGGHWVQPLWDFETVEDLRQTVVPAAVLVVDTEYLFRTSYRDSTGRWSFLSEPTGFRVGSGDRSGPTIPAGPRAVHVSTRSVVLQWQPSEDSESDVLGYRVLRDGLPLFGGIPFANTAAGDTSPVLGARHTYRVVAVNVAGLESVPSEPVVVDVPGVGTIGGWRLPAAGLEYLFDAQPKEDRYVDPRVHPVPALLDRTWVPASVDTWDGSRPGDGEDPPGGVVTAMLPGEAEDGGTASILSVEASNRRLLFVHDVGAGNPVDDGITLVVRFRVDPNPVDLPGPQSQQPGSPFRGQIGIAHRDDLGKTHFSMWLHDGKLHTNDGQSFEVDMLAFQSLWVTLQREDGEDGGDDGRVTHRLRIYRNGGFRPEVDALVQLSTRGTEDVFDGNYLEMGLANRREAGAIQVDYFGYTRGVHPPIPEGGLPAALFVRGDLNGDGEVTDRDAVAILGFLFNGTARPRCLDTADSNDSGLVNIADAIKLFQYLYLGAAAPPSPFEDCGTDDTDDALGPCEDSPCDDG